MLFHFTIIAGTEVLEAEWQFEAGSIDSARASARALLGGLAAERLCTEECEMLSVEIFDAAKAPLTELRLLFQELPK